MSNTGCQSNLNLHSTVVRNLFDQKKNSKLTDPSDDSDLSDLGRTDSDEEWGEIEECPQDEFLKSKPDDLILSEVLGVERHNIMHVLERRNPARARDYLVPQDPITEHTIELNRLAGEIKLKVDECSVLIKEAKAGNLSGSSQFPMQIDFPPFPKNFHLTRKLNDKIIELYSENPSIIPHAFSVAVGENYTPMKPENSLEATKNIKLKKDSHRKLLVMSVAYFLNNAGFESADSEALDVLVAFVDILFRNMVCRLRDNVALRKYSDKEKNLEYALDKTVCETGFGGMEPLLNYPKQLIQRHEYALESCVQLHKKFCSKQQILEKLLSKDIGEEYCLQTNVPQEDNSSKLNSAKKKTCRRNLFSTVPSKKNQKIPKDEASVSRKKKKKMTTVQ
ncbi:uncharacterized protein LOC129231545 [Uloborus diversus]|uniref:uncharacterized protein LOC129231545 n=1 Tax=Uloborus diversus TaxID=327109 RepID=UPI002409359C|nr:uncharacterized protein LOC129231545 [Uloborus diversus]XP_054721867.1 uncharacterized protein LOC129231545 [Uloborus diversus]XP_054721868.1 uncharacterized protein LOC129231545 [Uloborus diversus]